MQDHERLTIPTWNRAKLESKIDKINRRCERFGWPLVGVEWGETREAFVVLNEKTNTRTYYDVVDVAITTPRVGFDGWHFVAKLEKHGDSFHRNVIFAVPGETVPDDYRTAPSKCDHCQIDRERNNTYVLVHEDGSHKQVGSTCINDFLNGYDAEGYATMLQSIAALFDLGGDPDYDDFYDGEGGHRNSAGVDTLPYMATVACVIRADGWLSRGKAYESGLHGCSTADMANLLMDPKYVSAMSEEKRGKYAGHPEDKDKAKAVLEWLRSDYFDPDVRKLNDYEWNLSTVVADDFVTWKQTGIAASAFPAHDNYRGQQAAARQAKRDSKWVGETKKRLDLTVTVEIVRRIEGYYGVSTMYIMVDDDGNKFICFYSGHSFEADEGDQVNIRATVKKHELDKMGVKQTQLTRLAPGKGK